MRILVLDTADKLLLGLAEDANILESFKGEERNNTVEIIDKETIKLLEKVNLNISEIQLIIVGVGPGSHTGLRIGLAFVKALSQIKKIPIIGVSSSSNLEEMLSKGIEKYQNQGEDTFNTLLPLYYT